MGYTNSRVIRLRFPDRDGLIVRMRPLTMGTMRWFIRNGPALAALEGMKPSELTDDQAGMLAHLFEIFAEHLMSWNLEDEDSETGERTPVGTALDGVDSQEPAFIQEIMNHWMATCTAVAPPLSQGSPNGGPSPEGNAQTEPPSLSLAN
jgi:hypothetical protein